jgi:hypothetical protein
MQYCLMLLDDPFDGTINCVTEVEMFVGTSFDGDRIQATT